MTLIRKMKIDGMNSGNCATHVADVLRSIDGVSDAHVDFSSKMAEVVLKRIVEEKVFTDVVYDAGYDVIEICQ